MSDYDNSGVTETDASVTASDFKVEVGARLQAIREERGLTRESAAEVLRCSVDKIGSSERGRTALSAVEMSILLDFYDVRGARREHLEALAEKAKKRRSPAPWSAAVSPRLKRFFQLEETAVRVRTYNPLLVHGLAQTEDYARALIAGEGGRRPAQVEQLVRARMARKARLNGPSPVSLTIAIPEAGLRSGIGGPELMRGQIEHLIELSTSGRADIRVIPNGPAVYRSQSFAFSILDPAGRRNPVVYLEHMLDGVLIEDAARVSEFEDAFEDMLNTVALSPGDSVTLLATVAEQP
ncbi:helix-turn-helix domain-containing protein [Umezawaea tangerina]|uniref:Helix-turn-helix protein n=1 Tax=Umezawaea tangerina TaxID=84725 RepID=A0A2T0SPQ9_9PSEU|nr:helix-turn-helix transcriptional regulator [Umezawaea tangerina]PRY35397.1 helix-turn-helix protein [Umezawaea tangerina]